MTVLALVAMSNDSSAVDFSAAEAAKCLSTYSRIERRLCELIIGSSSPSVVSNVFAVYGVGYIHSSNAIPILIDIVSAEGLNEPGRLYSDKTPWDEPAVPERGEVHSVSFNLSIYPKPPTPAVGALTQMPVSLEALELAISADTTDNRSQEMLAWVAAAKYGTLFFDWLHNEYKDTPEKWQTLKDFADKRLVGRKLFSMEIYSQQLKKQFGSDIWEYDEMVRSLRKQAKDAKENSDEISYERIVSCLGAMGEPVEKPSLQQFLESVEIVHD